MSDRLFLISRVGLQGLKLDKSKIHKRAANIQIGLFKLNNKFKEFCWDLKQAGNTSDVLV